MGFGRVPEKELDKVDFSLPGDPITNGLVLTKTAKKPVVRHPEWVANPAIRKELFDTLRQLIIGAVITDTAGRRDVAHMELNNS